MSFDSPLFRTYVSRHPYIQELEDGCRNSHVGPISNESARYSIFHSTNQLFPKLGQVQQYRNNSYCTDIREGNLSNIICDAIEFVYAAYLDDGSWRNPKNCFSFRFVFYSCTGCTSQKVHTKAVSVPKIISAITVFLFQCNRT